MGNGIFGDKHHKGEIIGFVNDFFGDAKAIVKVTESCDDLVRKIVSVPICYLTYEN